MYIDNTVWDNLRYGDNFTKDYSFWKIVISVSNQKVTTLEGDIDCINLIDYNSIDDFRKSFEIPINSENYQFKYVGNVIRRVNAFIEFYTNINAKTKKEKEEKLSEILLAVSK